MKSRRAEQREDTLDLNGVKVNVTHAVWLPGRQVTGFSRWRHERVLAEEDPQERISAHEFNTPSGRIVSRVSITNREPEHVLAESRADLLEALGRDAKIERPLGILAGEMSDGRKCTINVNEYIPGKTLQALSFRFWSRKKRVELAGKVIGRIYENHRRNVLHNHLHLRNIILTPAGEVELIDRTRMSFSGEDPGNGNDPNGLRQSGQTFKLMDLSTFTRNSLYPEPRYKSGRKQLLKPAPLLRSEAELREALEQSKYTLLGRSLDEIMAELHEHHRERY